MDKKKKNVSISPLFLDANRKYHLDKIPEKDLLVNPNNSAKRSQDELRAVSKHTMKHPEEVSTQLTYD